MMNMKLTNTYKTLKIAQIRKCKLMRDGYKVEIHKTQYEFEVWSDKPVNPPEPVFGRFMEPDSVVSDILFEDNGAGERALDIGETHAPTYSELTRQAR